MLTPHPALIAGGMDNLARHLSPYLSAQLGQRLGHLPPEVLSTILSDVSKAPTLSTYLSAQLGQRLGHLPPEVLSTILSDVSKAPTLSTDLSPLETSALQQDELFVAMAYEREYGDPDSLLDLLIDQPGIQILIRRGDLETIQSFLLQFVEVYAKISPDDRGALQKALDLYAEGDPSWKSAASEWQATLPEALQDQITGVWWMINSMRFIEAPAAASPELLTLTAVLSEFDSDGPVDPTLTDNPEAEEGLEALVGLFLESL